MLWVKAFHIVFVASWFAGLFYLPRIFVNLAMVAPGSAAERDRLLLMARKLMRFTTLLMVPAVGLGLWLWLGVGIGAGSGWMHAKLALVLVVLGVSTLLALLGLTGIAGDVLYPMMLMMASMFFTSLYFSFHDTFDPQ